MISATSSIRKPQEAFDINHPAPNLVLLGKHIQKPIDIESQYGGSVVRVRKLLKIIDGKELRLSPAARDVDQVLPHSA